MHGKKKELQGYWIVPENQDVSKFDFRWRPDPYDPPYIHQFGTQWQKTGGPKYVVESATEVKYISVQHSKAPAIKDSTSWRNTNNMKFDFSWHPDATEPPFIYQFKTQFSDVPGPRYVVKGATSIKYMDNPVAEILPDMERWEILARIEEDSFDFAWTPPPTEQPYIHVFGNNLFTAEEMPTLEYHTPGATEKKFHNEIRAIIKFPTLDIVFVSNGETGAEERYQRLCEAAKRPVKRVNGVGGRENALRQAAEISDTEWFFCFPGKLSVNTDFNFDWHPPIKKESKHYIFYATNPINGLEYGHQAMVCYNKQLVLETIDYGLDFTMSKPHDVVPVNSGIAEYNLDPLMTWRTAFREAVKLQLASENGDQESAQRLEQWLQPGAGQYAELSALGARHGVEFYKEVNGAHDQLMLSFQWSWLKDRYDKLVQKV